MNCRQAYRSCNYDGITANLGLRRHVAAFVRGDTSPRSGTRTRFNLSQSRLAQCISWTRNRSIFLNLAHSAMPQRGAIFAAQIVTFVYHLKNVPDLKKRTMRAIISTFLFGLLLLPVTAVRADQMIPLAVEEIAARSQFILHGKVISKTVQRDEEGRIYTAVDLQVDEAWKGAPATNHFTIVHGGGILGDEGVAVTGQVEYEIGEEVVAFLVLNKKGEGVTLGLAQGKFHVWMDAGTKEKMTHNRFHGLNAGAADSTVNTPNHTVTMIHNRLTLADLKKFAVGGGK